MDLKHAYKLEISNDDLEAYRAVSKRITNPRTLWRDKQGGHRQRNFNAESQDGRRFLVYLRKNLHDERDFSCGLTLIQTEGKTLSLIRYNGSNHVHGDILYKCHIHRATAEALKSGRKADHHAKETNRYNSLDGAFVCLIEDCGVYSRFSRQDVKDLFDGS